MGTTKIEIGAAGRATAQNIRLLRRLKDRTLDDVSEQLAKIGRPMSKSILSQIENAKRRVDVDDLVALASVLDTSPETLLDRSYRESLAQYTALSRDAQDSLRIEELREHEANRRGVEEHDEWRA